MPDKQTHPDWQLVLDAGGPAEVVRKLNLTEGHAIQRVHNWKKRGIPALVKLEHPGLFPRNRADGEREGQQQDAGSESEAT